MNINGFELRCAIFDLNKLLSEVESAVVVSFTTTTSRYMFTVRMKEKTTMLFLWKQPCVLFNIIPCIFVEKR